MRRKPISNAPKSTQRSTTGRTSVRSGSRLDAPPPPLRGRCRARMPTTPQQGATMKYSRTTVAFAIAGALALSSTLVACSSSDDTAGDTNSSTSLDPNTKVTLNVVGLLPGSKPEAQTALAQEVTDFQAANPNITVKTHDYEWKATTFAADLAGGTLPSVFEIPFTDAKTLIANQQIADMQSYLTQ